MLARRAVVASLAVALGTVGTLGGCSLEPVPIEGERTDEAVAEGSPRGATDDVTNEMTDDGRADGKSGGNAQTDDGNDGTRDVSDPASASSASPSSSPSRSDDKVLLVRDSGSASATDGDATDGTDGGVAKGTDENASEDVTKDADKNDGKDATRVATGDADGTATRLLSFRCDQEAPEYPSVADPRGKATPYVVSYLPAVVAMGDKGMYVVELSVTYEPGDGTGASDAPYDEARWLSDAVRREVVRLVTAGVHDKGSLEDALSESVGARRTRGTKADGNPVVTDIDVYNMFATESVTSGAVGVTGGTGATALSGSGN